MEKNNLKAKINLPSLNKYNQLANAGINEIQKAITGSTYKQCSKLIKDIESAKTKQKNKKVGKVIITNLNVDPNIFSNKLPAQKTSQQLSQ